jgi:hypothetical protein
MSAAAKQVPRLPRRRRRAISPGALPPIEVKSAAHWRYQWHEEILKRSDLPRAAIAVAGVLMHRFNISKGYAEIGLSALAQQAGCSRNRASIATRQLRALGLVVVVNEGVRTGRRTLETCRYRLVYVSRGVGDLRRGVVSWTRLPSPVDGTTPSPVDGTVDL